MKSIADYLNFVLILFLLTFWQLTKAEVIDVQVISADTTWPNIGEPYEIMGNVTIADGATLTISPGVQVLVAPSISIIVNGTIQAAGDVDNPILFNRLDEIQAWNGIQFSTTSSNSLIQYAQIKGAANCLTVNGGDHEINASVITECTNVGISFSNSSNSILRNSVVKQNGTGINISGAPRVENNLIVENSNYGIYVNSSAVPTIRYNTIDLNGNRGVYFYYPGTATVFENNIVTRNQTGLYRNTTSSSYDFSSGYNNVWGNGADYSNLTAATTDLSSDPEYLDPYLGDRRLADGSPSKTAAADGGEIGAYGNGGDVVAYDPVYSTTPTTAGSLTQNERWSGEVVLTGTVTVARPWRLDIEPGTVVKVPASASLNIDSVASIVGTMQAPIIFEAAAGGGQWSGINIRSSASGSVIKYAQISGASTCITIAGSVHEINRSIISGCGTGIQISGAPRIENNLVVENSSYGIYVNSSAVPTIRYNTIDLNGNRGMYFYYPGTATVFENNIVTRNQTGLYRNTTSSSYDFSSGYNNVWGNGADYSNLTAATTDLSSDPEYLDPYLGDRRLADASPSKTAAADGGEIGAYGNGGDVVAYDPVYSTTPTTAGSLTQNERWSGEVVLTGTVTVARPWRLDIEPGTVVKVPASASLYIDSVASIVGTMQAPIIFEAAAGGGQWSGINIRSTASGSVIKYAQISGASTCITIAGAVHEINRNLISGCGTGMHISGAPRIENNLVVENSSFGIYVNSSAVPTIRYNTIDLNGSRGVYFYYPGTATVFENNIVTRNQTGLYRNTTSSSYDFNAGYNNVWGNGTDYVNLTAAATDLSSDPEYLDNDRHLANTSPSKTASSEGGEIGFYGGTVSLASPNVDPLASPTSLAQIVVSGNKETGLGIAVNGTVLVLPDDQSTWSTSLALHEGLNQLTIYAVDGGGNRSDSVMVWVTRDSSSPFITGSTPANGSSVSGPVSKVVLHLADNGTDIDFAKALATARLTSNVQGIIPGSWSQSASDLAFQATSELAQDTYTASVTLSDSLGNSALVSIFFTVIDGAIPDSAPVISNISFDGAPLADGAIISWPGTITLNADDNNGISRVEFNLDGNVFATDSIGSNSFSAFWDIVNNTDGLHILEITAFDTLGNRTTASLNLTIALASPPAPLITSPLNGTLTNQMQINVTGSAENGSEVLLFNNNVQVAGPLSLDSNLQFSSPVSLQTGANALQAQAQNRGGQSPLSGEVQVTVDTTIPPTPLGLSAITRSSGIIRLNWSVVQDPNVAGYNLYRSLSVFENISAATLVNGQPLTTAYFDDFPGIDGTYYYRVVAVSQAGTNSPVSPLTSAVADGTPPSALSIAYTPNGAFDSVTGRMGTGRVDVMVDVSEILSETPFLTLTPDGGNPIPVDLTKISDTQYKGFFDITEETLSGTTYAVFSARDLYGNRGTGIDSGLTIEVDTDGPSVIRLDVSPADPIKNDPSPATLQIELELNEALPQGANPQLGYLLSAPGREMQTVPLIHSAGNIWTVSFDLPTDAGLNEAETLTLSLIAEDELGNASLPIQGGNIFQVYQGDLQPLDPPSGLSAKALPGGQVHLKWLGVEGASDYQLFRAGPGEAELTAYRRTGLVSELTVDTEIDGLYRYAIASVRQANAQEAVSGFGEIVEVVADATPPDMPTGLALVLTGSGIRADWLAPEDTDALTYRFYRSNAEIVSVDALTPLEQDIVPLNALDKEPSDYDHFYSVTAIDAAGNESQPAVNEYFNFTLLPVSNLIVTQIDQGFPELTWQGTGNVNDYNVYLIENAQPIKLTDLPQSQNNFIDTGFTDKQRQYAVAQIDTAGVEGPRRQVLLPELSVSVPDDGLLRGVMNRMEYVITNDGEQPLSVLSVYAKIGAYEYHSAPVILAPGETRAIPVIFAGHADLPNVAGLTSMVKIETETGEISRIIRTSEITVADGSMSLNVLTDDFTRGATGHVRFSLFNSSPAEIDIVTALGRGGAESDDIRFLLTDADGNVLSTKPFIQALGDNAIMLADGRTVMRIAPGETFVSQPVDIPVPLASPDNVFIHGVIDRIFYHLGEHDEAVLEGIQTRRSTQLIDVAYYGEITSITPANSFGNEDIVITGRALERVSDAPIAWAPLKLVITVNGFERVFDTVSDRDGNFTYSFKPLIGESGRYQVAVVHPDLQDRPIDGEFTIGRVFVNFSQINLNSPRNFDQAIPLKLTAGAGSAATGVRIVMEAAEQPLGALPAGINLTFPQAVDLSAGQSADVEVGFRADETADINGVFILSVKSNESGAQTLAKVRVYYTLSEASPVIFANPNYMEMGVVYDDVSTQQITLDNRGLAALESVKLELLTAAGDPAPSWVFISSPDRLAQLAVGETTQVAITSMPTQQVSEGIHEFRLKVNSDNAAPIEINVYVTVTQSGIGHVQFHLSDIYTETLDMAGNPVLGLAGAEIRVQNEAVLSIDHTVVSDQNGEAFFNDLPAGRYKFKVTAPNHQEVIRRLQIQPGITIAQEVFLDYDLVTVEWSVTEISLEDRYEITLNATYETDVPAPVVIMEPGSVNLPDMKAGEVFYGELSLTNYGLIRAEEMAFQLPQNDAYRIELLGGLPSVLEAKERITIPYRIVALRNIDQTASEGSGAGDCQRILDRIVVSYTYKCINGEWRLAAAYTPIYKTIGDCSGTPFYGTGGFGGSAGGGGGTGGGIGGGGGTGGGGNGGSGSIGSGLPSVPTYPVFLPPADPLDDDQCLPAADPKEDPDCPDPAVDSPAQSTVHGVLREYQDEVEDLRVKIPGGFATIQRRYYDNGWHWQHERTGLKLTYDAFTGLVTSIDRGGVIYQPTVYGADEVFRNEEFRIVRDQEEFLWEDTQGNWERYDSLGRPLAFGNKVSTRYQLTYANTDVLRPAAMLDRNGNSVYQFEYDTAGHLTAVQDASGRRVEYRYTGDLLTTVVDVLTNEFTYQYDAKNRIMHKTDTLGRVVDVAYQANGDVASVGNREGDIKYYDFGYDSFLKERSLQIRTASGKVKEVWYTLDGEVLRVEVNGRLVRKEEKDGRTDITTDEKGNVTRVTRDEWDKVTGIVYPDGTEAKFEYENRFHQIKRQTNPLGVVTEYSYDDNGNLIRRVEAVGTPDQRTITYVYDAEQQLREMTLAGDANTEASTTLLTYDAQGNIATLTDPENNTTEFLQYDVLGNPLQIKDARGHLWLFSYDDKGRLKSKTDPENNTTAYEYDDEDNRVAVIDANQKRFEFAYNQSNQVIRSTDPFGAFSEISYNTDGLPVLLTDQEGHKVENQYDNEQRLLASRVGTESIGFETRYLYDESNDVFALSDKPVQIDYPTYSQRLYYDRQQRQVRSSDVLDADTTQTTAREYDALGNVISETDQQDRVSQYQYDNLNRLILSTDPATHETAYQYDDRDKLIALTDPNGGITRFEYDRNGRMTAEIRPEGETTRYQYDAVGNRVAVMDAKGQVIKYQYSPANRLELEQHFAVGDPINPVKTISYSYDKLGRLKGYDDGATSANYSYDDLGRLIATSTNYGGFSLTSAYSYYANGLKHSYTGPDGVTYLYHYDETNRLTAIELPDGQRITYNSYDWNVPNRVTLPGGSTTEFSYDPLQRVTDIHSKDPIDATIMNYAYERSPVGNIEAKRTEHGDYLYQYDELDRLTQAINPVMTDEDYTYDALGNRLTAAGVSGEWQYDLNNRLLGYAGTAFSYDANGNMTGKTTANGERHYSYDIKNRLNRIERADGSVVAEYYYDPFGRRLWKNVAGVRTYFAYADEGLVGEFAADGSLIKSYGYKPGSLWTTDPLFQLIDGRYYWYQNDHLATSQQLIDSNGIVVWRGKQTAFGQVAVEVAGIENNLRFPGQYYDGESGLSYNWHRYYDAGMGRYVSSDPIGLSGGLNLFNYVYSNPLLQVDVLGFTPGEGYKTRDEAAFHAAKDAHEMTKKSGFLGFFQKEFGGFIYQDPKDCLFYYQTPVPGSFIHVNGNDAVEGLVNEGIDVNTVKPAGFFHSHPTLSIWGKERDRFSSDDIKSGDKSGIPQYLAGGTAGDVYKYTPPNFTGDTCKCSL